MPDRRGSASPISQLSQRFWTPEDAAAALKEVQPPLSADEKRRRFQAIMAQSVFNPDRKTAFDPIDINPF